MITIICGTNRTNSVTKKVAIQYKEILKTHNTESVIIDLADLPSDFIVSALYERAGTNEDFNVFREIVDNSEKFVFIVPEYNGSFPGVLKAFVDGQNYPHAFKHKKCALVGISSGSQGASIALSHLTDIFNYAGMHVLANKPKLSKISNSMTGDRIEDDTYLNRLLLQAEELIAF